MTKYDGDERRHQPRKLPSYEKIHGAIRVVLILMVLAALVWAGAALGWW